jgi:Family of unknown function (DUF6174)
MRITAAVAAIYLTLSSIAQSGTAAEALTQLARAEARWNANHPNAYSYSVRYSAFILEYGCEKQSYNVVGRRSSPRESGSCGSRKDKFGDVPALFRLVRRYLHARPDEASISFDERSGYPVKFYCGSRELKDDYFQFEIEDFRSVGDAP